MALISCTMSETSNKTDSNMIKHSHSHPDNLAAGGEERVEPGPADNPKVHRCRHSHDHHQLEDEDSGCECSLDELEGMDAWTKTLVAIKVLTAFKKRRKKKLEQEKLRKERRKTLWKRLGFKLQVFNIFANRLSSDDPAVERIAKLKRKLGKEKIYNHFKRINLVLQKFDGFQRPFFWKMCF